MSSIKNIIFALVGLLILGGEAFYMMTAYKTEENLIAQNLEEIRLTNLRIEELEKRVDKLPETEKELELVTNQKQAILNMLPTYSATSKNMAEMFRYMDINHFMDVSYESLEDNQEESRTDGVRSYQYKLSFVGGYEESIAFIDNLNQSYQVTNIANLEMTNEVQDMEKEENWGYLIYFGEDIAEVVKTTLQVTMYSRYEEAAEKQEIYQPDLEMQMNKESLFAFNPGKHRDVEEIEGLVDELIEEVVEEIPLQESIPVKDVFTLNVGDRITSGDTYKLDGPGSNVGDYVGLSSQTNVAVTIEVFSDYYTMSIEDENGEQDTTQVSLPLIKPYLEVISTMRPLDEVMPNVHVNIHNHTEEIMEVELTGTMLDNIYVFDEQGERITQGETKGNVTLT